MIASSNYRRTQIVACVWHLKSRAKRTANAPHYAARILPRPARPEVNKNSLDTMDSLVFPSIIFVRRRYICPR
jgi:hypothetical protein